MNRLVAQLGVRVESPEWSILTKDGNIEHCAYPDMHYYNSRKLGISYQVKPTGTYASRIVSIDIYNGQPRWGTYPDYPILLNYNTTNGTRGLSIEPHTTALDFVLALGEPTRKGGGEAGGATARALGPALWMEWTLTTSYTPLYLMAEFRGKSARAPDRWELGRGSCATWATITLSILPPQT